MGKKSAAWVAAAVAPSQASSKTSPAAPATKGGSGGSGSSSGSGSVVEQSVRDIAAHYQKTTPQRTKLLDAFMAFLVAVGALQVAYCLLVGNFPFNAFLGGFSATVGQFVLTASLRIQTTEANKAEFPSVSPERAFADYIVASLILHFFCINFVN